jgi:hypothetical protein
MYFKLAVRPMTVVCIIERCSISLAFGGDDSYQSPSSTRIRIGFAQGSLFPGVVQMDHSG